MSPQKKVFLFGTTTHTPTIIFLKKQYLCFSKEKLLPGQLVNG
jgi:hypothetical protein